jgi:hypothetical protein
MKYWYYLNHASGIYSEVWTDKPLDFSKSEVKLNTLTGSIWNTPIEDVYTDIQPWMKTPNGKTRQDFRADLIEKLGI